MKIVLTQAEFEHAQITLFNIWDGVPDGYDVMSVTPPKYPGGDATIELSLAIPAPEPPAQEVEYVPEPPLGGRTAKSLLSATERDAAEGEVQF